MVRKTRESYEKTRERAFKWVMGLPVVMITGWQFIMKGTTINLYAKLHSSITSNDVLIADKDDKRTRKQSARNFIKI